jgi:hypothetical protein
VGIMKWKVLADCFPCGSSREEYFPYLFQQPEAVFIPWLTYHSHISDSGLDHLFEADLCDTLLDNL